ncbi:alpha-hydroxy acid oxidase [Amorphus sp. 3PC139-8]|uniref:alpha-hydroxy acid oxidase n=1 Tax=Amorphus sp. 3PC139-8 TaxID=2735676 RepID=UPI00345D5BC2
MDLTCYDDFRRVARRRVPRLAFDYLDGGSGTEAGLVESVAAFERIRLIPESLVNVDQVDTSCELFGHRFAQPFGFAPLGLTGLIWPGTDMLLAKTAVERNIPHILSTAATTTIEDISRASGGHSWFQLYVARDEAVADDIVDRVDQLGVDVLFVTVDVPVPGRRLRDIRNGLKLPLQPSLRLAVDLARRPSWCAALARSGAPRLANLERYADPAATAGQLAAFMATQSSGRLDWAVLERLRKRWPRKLVVKGILSPQVAARSKEMGADGVVVSTHGGRQLNSAIASIDALPAIRAAVGPDFPVLIDSGVRSGEHVAKAIARGADFALMGRLPLMAIGASGGKGLALAVDQVADDLARTLALLGVTSLDQLGPHLVAS